MSQAVQDRLREFARMVLERRGGLVDWPETSQEGLALLPSEAAASLGCPETLPLSFHPRTGGLTVNLAADFLDRIRPLVEAEPRIGAFHIPQLYLKQAAMDEPVARAFTWLNARVRVRGAQPARTEYHAWHFRALVESADRWEDILQVTLNAASMAQVRLPDLLDLPDLQPGQPAAAGQPEGPDQSQRPALEGPRPAPPAATYRQACRRAIAAVDAQAAPFVARMESQHNRDRERLKGYYGALLRENRQKTAHAAADDRERLAAKRQAVELELRRKLAELDDRYAFRVELAPLVLIRLDCPLLAVRCEVFRKQARRTHTVYWNAILKELEPLACARCGASTFSVAFTDDAVDGLCPGCAR